MLSSLGWKVYAIQSEISEDLHDRREAIIQKEQEFLLKLPPIKPITETILRYSVESFLRVKYRKNPEGLRRELNRYEDMGPYEKRMLLKHLPRLTQIYGLVHLAEAKAKAHCGGQTSAGAEDAYRHIMWSSLLTYSFGSRVAHEITASHEKRLEKLSKKQMETIGFSDLATLGGELVVVDGVTYIANWTTEESKMDMFNNFIGRLLGEEARAQTNHFEEAVQYLGRRTFELLEKNIPIVIRRSSLRCYSYPNFSKEYQQKLKKRPVQFVFEVGSDEAVDLEKFDFYLLGGSFALGSWHLDDAVGPLVWNSQDQVFTVTVDIPLSESRLDYKIFKLDKSRRKVHWQSELMTNNIVPSEDDGVTLYHPQYRFIFSMK
jgi:hypothetical protein